MRRLLHALLARLGGQTERRALALEARALSSRLCWEPPATTISVAGLHGGAGATTLCMLLARAATSFSTAPVLTVDLAGRGRGGLAVLAGAAGQTTAEATAAVAVVHGSGVEEPFGTTPDGVRVIGTHPDGIEELDRSHESLVARLVEAVDRGTDDARLAALLRAAVAEERGFEALRWDSDQAADAVGQVLDHALPHHSLVAIDLGMVDSEPLARTVAIRSDLHIWVLPARSSSLEIAERRLPLSTFEPTMAEAIAVWPDGPGSPSPQRLSRLGDLRGCPVVRIASHGDARDWSERLGRCLSGISELCELAR